MLAAPGGSGGGTAVSTDWKTTPEVADGFNAYDDLPERVIGYPAVFAELQLGTPGVRNLLDYGCGPGKVALRAVQHYPDVAVRAVDISPRMLEIARSQRSHDRIQYQQLDGPRVPGLADGSIDAAMTCYVFINIAELQVIADIAAEVYRVLRPGGRYVVLDTNPDTTGIQFCTFRSGDPGQAYGPGELRRVLLSRPDGQVLELADHHWPRQTYHDVLTGAGFSSVSVRQPLLGETPDIFGARPGSVLAAGLGELPEAVHPPFQIVTGVK
jgi:ubiquinone/menaquinone biosynthesis C-methylase UbiE